MAARAVAFDSLSTRVARRGTRRTGNNEHENASRRFFAPVARIENGANASAAAGGPVSV
ncbi:hypothetical protein NJ7G_1647 [Natrinema sp. J7-2]|nr:hypothetical protein NJ7G_1647 [Natrinema sp. J7-2]